MNLADPGLLKSFLARHGLSARKGLGQHFLTSAKVVGAIVEATGDVDGVLEIGPGPGILTGPLSEGRTMIAIELDDRMIPALQESAPGVTIYQEDALKSDLGERLRELPAPRAVVSNLPYYITGPLLGAIADVSAEWSVAVLMMQREVGVRILAQAGNRERGALSVRMQAEFEIRKVIDVPPGAFSPPPRVDSIVLSLRPTSTRFSAEMIRLVRAGFAQPRKTLSNNLQAAGFDRTAVERAGLEAGIRPHFLTLSDWKRIAHFTETS